MKILNAMKSKSRALIVFILIFLCFVPIEAAAQFTDIKVLVFMPGERESTSLPVKIYLDNQYRGTITYLGFLSIPWVWAGCHTIRANYQGKTGSSQICNKMGSQNYVYVHMR